MAQVKLLEMRRIPSPDPARVGKFDVLVVYELEDRSQHATLLPEEGLTDQKLAEQIKKEAGERARLIGKTLTI